MRQNRRRVLCGILAVLLAFLALAVIVGWYFLARITLPMGPVATRRGRGEEWYNHLEGAWQAGAAFPLVMMYLCPVIL